MVGRAGRQEPDGGLAAVHSGILASAAALHHDLEEHSILTALFTGAAVDDEAWQAFQAELGARVPSVGAEQDGAALLAGSTAALVGSAAPGPLSMAALSKQKAVLDAACCFANCFSLAWPPAWLPACLPC